jgi:phage shock protein E
MFSSLFASNKPSHEGRKLVAEGAILLDVRTPAEFNEGHVEGARNIAVQELGGRMREIPSGAKVVVYCRSGGRSAMAAQMLRAQGHTVLDVGAMSSY